jgi:hypothetical protein
MYRSNKAFSISRVLPLSIALLLAFGYAPLALSQIGCLPVHGLSFERVDSYKLLAVREGRNIAFVSIYFESLPSKLGAFRFFSPNLCASGAEDKFTIDGKLYHVDSIQMFKQ